MRRRGWRRRLLIASPLFGFCALAAVVVVTACGDDPMTPATPDSPVPTTVAISPASATFRSIGDTVRMIATVSDQYGQAMAEVAVVWNSSDTDVATVTEGLVAAVGNGSGTVTATAGSATASAEVAVAQSVAQLAVSPAAHALVAVGDTALFVAEARDGNGHVVADAEFVWSSDDESVVTVDTEGVVTALANGSAQITATSGPTTASAEVTVDQRVAEVNVSPPPTALEAFGDTVRLSAQAMDANGHAVAETTFAWASGDPLVAVVDSAGLVTAVGNGAAEIIVTTGEMIASTTVNVRQTPSEIAVSPAGGGVWVGRDGLQLEATVFDANGHILTDSPSVRWSSSDTTVAQVEPSQGVVTGVAKGTATITAMSQDAIGTASITVRMERGGPYPINVTYLGDVPELIRQEMDRAAAAWGKWLAPTLSAPYVLTEDLWLRVRSDLSPNGFDLFIEAGDTLAPGLNVWVTTRTGGSGWGWAWSSFYRLDTVQSDVPTAPWAVVSFNWQAIQRSSPEKRQELAYETAVHELGHAVGIGTSARWRRHVERPDPTKRWDSFFTDSVTIAVFDNMGGADFSSKKIPLSHDAAHWDGCAGHFDIMGNHRNGTSTITELSLAAMAEGYEYDPALLPRRKLDRNSWNWDFANCKDGRWAGPSDQAAGDRLRGFAGDVIRDPARGRR